MKTSRKTNFLITIQNEIGVFRPIISGAAEESKNYKLISCINHNIKDINNIPEYLYYLLKAHTVRLVKNDIIYVKLNLINVTYRYTGDNIDNAEALKGSLIKIDNFDTNEMNSFINELRLKDQVYDCITGEILPISELKQRKTYMIKEGDESGLLYELYYLDNKKYKKETRLFKYATTFSNVMYEFNKKLNEERDLILINQKRIGSVNI